VFDDGQLLAYGHFSQVGGGHAERLMNFRVWLLKMFEEWKPAEIVYEMPFQGRTSFAFGVLTKYVAAIEMAHFEYKGEEVPDANSIAAHAVKKAIKAPRPKTGKAKRHDANKKIVLLMVNERYGINLKFKANDLSKSVSQDDDADAIALNWAWHERRAKTAEALAEEET
jgi:Holliday junction resolvasome RuvABC endonuclease subunit